ncbi:MAG TPA: outer membrane protein assembly factor BamD [Flavobacteriaceae bacterium]|nr:outer membrane protein assembly factor BamD [Flavobacteriaceae bacterium]
MFLGIRNSILILFAVVMLSGCSTFQKTLKEGSDNEKYEMAVKLYEEGIEKGKNSLLKKSLRLQEQIINKYRGRPQGQKLSFLYADTYYKLKDYYISGYQFERFVSAYPQSDKRQEAMFKSAKSFYNISPRYTVDQKDTYQALDKFQQYLNQYPEGEFSEKSNEYAAEMQHKLEKKAYEIAKQYHHTLYYKSAIEAMDNFILDFPGSAFREKAYYYKFESAYLLAINSYRHLMADRLKEAKDLYEDYIREYPNGEFQKEANEHLKDIESRLRNLESTT